MTMDKLKAGELLVQAARALLKVALQDGPFALTAARNLHELQIAINAWNKAPALPEAGETGREPPLGAAPHDTIRFAPVTKAEAYTALSVYRLEVQHNAGTIEAFRKALNAFLTGRNFAQEEGRRATAPHKAEECEGICKRGAECNCRVPSVEKGLLATPLLWQTEEDLISAFRCIGWYLKDRSKIKLEDILP
jgi:hypothetical protein